MTDLTVPFFAITATTWIVTGVALFWITFVAVTVIIHNYVGNELVKMRRQGEESERETLERMGLL